MEDEKTKKCRRSYRARVKKLNPAWTRSQIEIRVGEMMARRNSRATNGAVNVAPQVAPQVAPYVAPYGATNGAVNVAPQVAPQVAPYVAPYEEEMLEKIANLERVLAIREDQIRDLKEQLAQRDPAQHCSAPMAHCGKCNHEWKTRTATPLACPRCKARLDR